MMYDHKTVTALLNKMESCLKRIRELNKELEQGLRKAA